VDGKLLDEVQLEDIVLAGPEQKINELMDRKIFALNASDDRETAFENFRKYDALAMPVVDSRGAMVGIVTVDDVLDVVEEEDSEDFQKFTGVSALEGGYFQTSFAAMLKKRLPWLMLLLIAECFTVIAITAFEGNFQSAFSGDRGIILLGTLAFFIPLINSPAGNTGTQVSGLMIRGIAVQEMETSHWRKILLREILMGFVLSVVLGGMGFAAVIVLGRDSVIALSVALAIVGGVNLGNILGAMLPFFFKRIGIDPAVTSGPFIASLMDVSCIIIYLSIAMTVLLIAGVT